MVKLKRAYEQASEEDGVRILVDGLWPRGVSKEKAQLDRWAKDLSPSKELREWFHHETSKWPEFQKRYEAELDGRKEELNKIAKEAKRRRVTLIYGARDEEHNEAVVLKNVIDKLKSL